MATLKVPDTAPSPTQDSEKLKKAFHGLGTDEKAIIWILGHRNASQRKKIRYTYQELYNESLIDRLKSELSGDFKKAVILWTMDPPERDAKMANKALQSKDKGIDHLKVIIEIACTTSPHHLMAVREAYCSMYDCSLEEDIACRVTPPLRQLLVGLVSSYRYDKEVVDEIVAKSEAAKLRDAIERKQLDDDDVVWILCTRNVFQLRATFECYRQIYGNPIDQDIKCCGTGNLESVLQMVIWCIDSPEKYFSKVLRASVVGLGTEEDSLTRAIVTRAEVDLMKIKEEYFNMHKTSLDDAIVGDTSGDYKDFLTTLLGTRL
ncbi:PREDICTED: annexin D3-like [Nelumbo nucifera]|nr:PREDICTED: annexin D3-like [Nelumbo nucifera]